MIQPEIKFVSKLIKMRKAIERQGGNKVPGVMISVDWLERHIKANSYSKPNESRSFFLRNIDRIDNVMFWSKKSIVDEFLILKIGD